MTTRALRMAIAAGAAALALGSAPLGHSTGGVTRAVQAAPDPAAGLPDRTAWLVQMLATAPDGATVDVPAGVYRGPFVVDRPLHLNGHGNAVLLGDGLTHVVAVRAADVQIEGFDIRSSGLDLAQDHAAIHVTGARAVIRHNRITESLHGVYVRQADHARIEQNTIVGKAETLEPVDPFRPGPTPSEAELCEVTLNQNRRGNGVHVWNSKGHVIAGNVIRDTRDGVYFSFVDGSDVRDNDIQGVRYGLHYMYSDENRFEDNVFRDNAAGAALMNSKSIVMRRNQFLANRSHRAYGVLLQTVEDTVLVGNRIAGNSMGVFIENGHGNQLLDNTIVNNHVGVHVSDSADANTFAGNTFAGNLHTVETSGANRSNRWAHDGRGNRWDTAVALDLNRDGVSDLPHRELDLFGETRRALPAIGLLAGSPGERLLRFVHARVPLPGFPAVSDPAPLVKGERR